MTPETTKIIATWALGGDTGISSKYLAACVLGKPDAGERCIGHNAPSDRGDFGRCYRLSLLLPAEDLERGLNLAAERSEKWAAIRDHWEKLCAMHVQMDDTCDVPGCHNGMVSSSTLGRLEMQMKECYGPVHKLHREFYQFMEQLGL